MKVQTDDRRQVDLDLAWERLIDDPVCQSDRDRNQASQFVRAVGPVPAALMLVGEAPGRTEDQIGRPFVGRAGRMLDNALEAVGLNRADIYITNIVKYRPSQNHTPSQTEVDNCHQFFEAEMDCVAPRLIGCLGLTASRYFFADLNMAQNHGQPRQLNRPDHEPIMIPCYHPAASLYNRDCYDRLVSDLGVIKNLLDQANPNKENQK